MKGLIIFGIFLGLICVLINAKPLEDKQINEEEREAAVDLLRRITREANSGTQSTPYNNKGKGGGKNKPCKYRKAPWSQCDPVTKMKTRTVTLRKGDDKYCEANKIQTKECKGKGGGKKNKENKQNNNNENNKKQQKQGMRARNGKGIGKRERERNKKNKVVMEEA